MSNDLYVFTLRPTTGGDPDLSSRRGGAIADAHVRFRRMRGDDVVYADGAPDVDAATVERWGQWAIGKLEAAQRIDQRAGEGWRLRSGKPHAESERRLDELTDWSATAIAGQRALLEHVADPGDSGNELEQSLSKLAASGWNVDSKKDKGPPTIHYAAGDMPLAEGDDWRAAGAIHPRLAAALAWLLAAVPPAERADVPPSDGAVLARRLPAVAIAGAGGDQTLLDLRTIAKALRDVGALDLPSGEPLGPVLAVGPLELSPVTRRSDNGAAPGASDSAALAGTHGADALRFALLHAAAPAKPFKGGEDVVGYAAAFLGRCDDFATARLEGATGGAQIDPRDGLRRRLAGWCDIAVTKSTENHAALETHRATRNAVELLKRIDDFAARATAERGSLDAADREAVAAALTLLAQLLAPLAPTTADDLWRRAGHDGSAADAGWPSTQRERTPA